MLLLIGYYMHDPNSWARLQSCPNKIHQLGGGGSYQFWHSKGTMVNPSSYHALSGKHGLFLVAQLVVLPLQ